MDLKHTPFTTLQITASSCLRGFVVAFVVAAGCGLGLVSAQRRSADWPQWRGPNRDGVVSSFTEPKTWPQQLTKTWKVDVGIGYSTPVLVGDRIYMYSRRGDKEVLAALDAATGKEIWQSSYAAPFNLTPAAASHDKGPKSTPTFAGGKLYTLGMSGIVTAFDAASGKQLWQKPSPPVAPLYHTAMSPLVDRGLVIVHVGGHGQGALTAFDANSGAVKWSWNGDGPAYGSPITADFDGTRQVIVLTQENLIGVAAATGDLLWKRPFTTSFTQNAITPILYGQTVIVSGLEKGVTAFTVTKRDGRWATENVWDNQDVALYMANGVIFHDMLIGMSHKNSGQFFALDAKTGKTLWRSEPRQATNAAITRAGELVFLLKDDGELIVARPTTSALAPVKRYTVADSATWSAPTIAGNRIFVKDTSNLTLWTW
jgi:outer membrane protein assembly factor BamB